MKLSRKNGELVDQNNKQISVNFATEKQPQDGSCLAWSLKTVDNMEKITKRFPAACGELEFGKAPDHGLGSGERNSMREIDALGEKMVNNAIPIPVFHLTKQSRTG
ncbi:20304_t:CDS:2, partial [Gigaspora rosea]